ncbi:MULTISPECIES: HsdR family type I site-specific deoxyribonuclease [unclassified Streptomyces]|uniref:type I restriction endonuclease subunit R n=1 Tax=unclassified Streptomyces TaxID=2593676 RepID=UPI000DC7E979|nr:MULTISPECIES: HsdR family type I site-specific deoxyribonuclease [unclassified Streptomyces]AWZ07111.1 restriction endonuclease subunit R [Streptomyces sp. ICC4]AWZ14872.1 restriction endonuclease subunit R [Streptomyces sp. ICC1]
MSGPEYKYVEAPLIAQLIHRSMGWRHAVGKQGAELQEAGAERYIREGADGALLTGILRSRLDRLNRMPDGATWVDDVRAAAAIAALVRGGARGGGLVAANEAATEALIEGVAVPGVDGWDGGRAQKVRFVDWEVPENNDFLVVSQFPMTIPGARDDHGKPRKLIADLVLFVNGIPLVVIECKKLKAGHGDAHRAVQQLRRYANQKQEAGVPEGSEQLFRTVQLTVATTGDTALLGTFTARPKDYVVWRDAYPLETRQVAETMFHKDDAFAGAQKVLVAGVLHPHRLLDIVRNFVVFKDVEVAEGRTARVKIAPRYQQYRAVCKAIERLQKGETKQVHGKEDKRGGIIWHTQGSGKSLTMVFLVRKLRSTPGLGHFKVVVVTDRKQLQDQLSETAALAGEKPDVITRASQVPKVLGLENAGLVFVMIQKQQDGEKARQNAADSLAHQGTPGWGPVNDRDGILIMIDEAHRSHGSALHQNLMESLPNAARIGFTGTPIIMNRRKLTTTTFGEFIDTYRLKDAEDDGAIVPIYYEGHIAKGAVTEGEALDEAFQEEFEELTDEQYDELQKRYAKSSAVLGADDMIRRKARHMLRHYVEGAMKEGFKAQVVAHSRGIAVRYREALVEARDELVAEVEKAARPPARILTKAQETPSQDRTPKQRLLVSAHRNLALLKVIDFVPVISPDSEDDKDWAQWSNGSAQEKAIEAFRSPFPVPEALTPESRPTAVLIVRTMLLTGFDAPIEQVMYLDRRMREAELLQAVARVNRTYGEKKQAGYVVDYAGVSKALNEAMQAYATDEAEGKPIDFEHEENKLEHQCDALRHHLGLTRALVDPADTLAVHKLVDTLEDEERRIEYRRLLREFLSTLDLLLPREATRPYQLPAKLFGFIAQVAKQRFSEEEDGFDPAAYGERVAELIDEHVKALGVERAIEPTRLTSDDFRTKVEQMPSSRAKASMMAHAVRNHIELHFNENPVAYDKLRVRLEEVLKKYAEDWAQQLTAFESLSQEAHDVAAGRDSGLPADVRSLSKLEQAVYQQLTTVITDGVIADNERVDLIGLAREVRDIAVRHTARKDLFYNTAALHDLQSDIWMLLALNDRTQPSVDSLAPAVREIIQHNKKDL